MLLNVCLCRAVQAWLDQKEKRATLLASRWVEFVKLTQVPVLDSENNPVLFVNPLCCSFSGSSWTSRAAGTPRRVQLPQRSKNAHVTPSDSFLFHLKVCLFDLCAHCPPLCLCFLKTVFPIPPRPHCKMPVSFYFPHAVRFMRKTSLLNTSLCLWSQSHSLLTDVFNTCGTSVWRLNCMSSFHPSERC